MYKTEYYTLGSLDEAEGLTPYSRVVDEDGNLIVGYQNHKALYKVKQVTKEEFIQLHKDFFNSSNKGHLGLVNAKGKVKADEENKAIIDEIKAQKDKEQVLITKRLARQLDAGLIDKEDLDTAIEIELPGVPVDQTAVLKDQISSLRVKHETM